MKSLLMICLVTASLATAAQKQTSKWQYFGLHQAGILAGSNAEKLGVLTTNGVSKGNWYAGIGTGIDWYGLKTIPVLLSLHKAFGSNRHQPFVYGNAGPGFVWEKNYSDRFSSYNFKNGITYETGLGYFINLKNKTAFTISAGYSYKQVSMDKMVSAILPDPPIVISTPDHYQYNYRRIAIRLGIKI